MKKIGQACLVLSFFLFLSSCQDIPLDEPWTIKPSEINIGIDNSENPQREYGRTAQVIWAHFNIIDPKGVPMSADWSLEKATNINFQIPVPGSYTLFVESVDCFNQTNNYSMALNVRPNMSYNVWVRAGGIVNNIINTNALNETAATYGLWSEMVPISVLWDNNTKLDIWHDWDGNMTITEDTINVGEGVKSWRMIGTGNWIGMGIRVEPLTALRDFTDYANGSLHFMFKGLKPFKVGIKSGGTAPVERWIMPGMMMYYGYQPDNNWHEVIIPMSAFSGINFTKIEQMFMFAADNGMGYTVGSEYHLDGIYYSKLDPYQTNSDTNDWVIMNYIDGDNNLEDYMLTAANQLESVNLNGKGIRIIALIDRAGYTSTDGGWKGARLYDIKYDPAGINQTLVSLRLTGMGLSATGANQGLNMGDEATLRNFISYVKTYFPAKHYALIFNDHGGGWKGELAIKEPVKGVCWDDSSGGDYLTMAEVKNAIIQGMGGSKLDVLGFDACLMGLLEIGYQMKNAANVLIASEEVEWAPGWDYYGFLMDFVATSRTPGDFAMSVVNSYGDYYNKTKLSCVLSALDLSRIAPVINALDGFVTNVLNKTAKTSILSMRTNTLSFYYPEYADICDFLSHFTNNTYAVNLVTAVQNMVLSEYHSSYYYNAHGLAIYFPFNNNTYQIADYNSNVIDFPGVSKWAEFVHGFVGR